MQMGQSKTYPIVFHTLLTLYYSLDKDKVSELLDFIITMPPEEAD
jgi:hypothetical protein